MEKKYLLDDSIKEQTAQEIEEEFSSIINEEINHIDLQGNNQHSSLAKVGAILKNVANDIGNTAEKVGNAAGKISKSANKFAKTASKTTQTITEAGKNLLHEAQNTDYKGVIKNAGESVQKGAANFGNATSKAVANATEKAKDVFDKTKDTITPEQMQELLDICYKKSINGIPQVSKSVDELADDYLKKYSDPKLAAKALINNQIAKCTTSGFLTSPGGLITLPVAVPANVSSVLYVQMRMIAALAKIGGFDPKDDQVQTLVYVCLTGKAVSDVLKGVGVKLGNKLAVNGMKKDYWCHTSKNKSSCWIQIDY